MTAQVDFLIHPQTRQPLITGTFHDAQLYDYEYKANRDAVRLRELLGRADDVFTEGYSEILVYTVALQFHFSADTPDSVRALETWWQMVQRGDPAVECYLYMTNHVHGRVIRELRSAINSATRLWTTAEEKSFLELTEQEQADPN